MTQIVTAPSRGTRCREATCRAALVLAKTTRGHTMPLAWPAEELDVDADERGLFVLVTGCRDLADRAGVNETVPLAVPLRAARELGLTVGVGTPVYRAHWGTCTKADRFRRGD